MRFYETRQSNTSPIKYVLELSPKEAEKVKKELSTIIKKIKSEESKWAIEYKECLITFMLSVFGMVVRYYFYTLATQLK